MAIRLMRVALMRVGALSIGVLCAAPSLAQQYTVTDLGTLDNLEGSYSEAWAINERGQIVGQASLGGRAHAFLWVDGTMRDLGVLSPTDQCSATAINDAGQVVGQCNHVGGSQAFVWTAETGMTALPLPDPSGATGINNQGHIVGWNGSHAFLYRDGSLEDLGPGVAKAINDNDQAVGSDPQAGGDALLWDDTGEHHLGTLDEGRGVSQANVISATGLAVGRSSTDGFASDVHAVLWTPDGLSDLGTLGGHSADAIGINGNLIVGNSQTSSGAFRAFLYDINGPGYASDLNDLVAPDSGWILVDAVAVTAAGQIIGYGTVNGATHAFLLTPVV